MEDVRRVADYFVIAGLDPSSSAPDGHQLLDEYSLEVNLKPSAYQDPITDITVIIPSLGENVPDYYQLLDATPTGLRANLNHGSFRAPEVFLCFRRGRDRPPLVDIGVLYDGKERVMPDSQVKTAPSLSYFNRACPRCGDAHSSRWRPQYFECHLNWLRENGKKQSFHKLY